MCRGSRRAGAVRAKHSSRSPTGSSDPERTLVLHATLQKLSIDIVINQEREEVFNAGIEQLSTAGDEDLSVLTLMDSSIESPGVSGCSQREMPPGHSWGDPKMF